MTYLYINKDDIEKSIITKLNSYLNTPVSVEKIDLTLFEKFPQVSLQFKDIRVEGSTTTQKTNLMVADELLLSFNIWDIINENYEIQKLYLDNAYISMLVDKNGAVNYSILKPQPKTDTKTKSKPFTLKAIELSRTDFEYVNEYKNQSYHLVLPAIKGDFSTLNNLINTEIKGETIIKTITAANTTIFKNKNIDIDAKLSYNLATNSLTVANSSLGIKGAKFLLMGELKFAEVSHIDFTIKSAKSDVRTLLSLTPDKIYKTLSPYESKGEVRFDALIKGNISTTQSPIITVAFGCNHVTLTHPESKIKISDLQLSGQYSNQQGGYVFINDFSGAIDQNPIKGNFSYANFKDPYLKGYFRTEQSIENWLKLAHFKNFKTAKGKASIELKLDGKVSEITAKDVSKTHVEGIITADIDQVVLQTNKQLVDTKLRMHLKNSDLMVDTLIGNFENTDFKVEGAFKNFIAFVFEKTNLLNLQGSLISKSININDFYAPQVTTDTSKSILSLPDNMIVDFTSTISNLKFNNLNFKNFNGELKITPKNIDLISVKTKLAGGDISMSGNINTLHQTLPRIDATIELKKIHIDTVMHLFKNFDQRFITNENLQGQLTTKIYINCSLSANGKINPATVFSNIDVAITNGRLLNFEPMRKLAKYIDEKELADIKFSELKNNFHIENSVVYVPEMTIKSNLNTVTIMGTHNFNKELNYKLKVNLRRKKKDSDEKFGAVEQDATGNTQVFLKITGNQDNIKIGYDKDALKTKLKDNWKEEKEDFKKLFKKEPPKEEKKVIVDPEQELIDLD